MGRNWAITVGINQYYNLKDLAFAGQDAAAMRDYFLEEAGFEQVYFFGNGADPIIGSDGPPIPAEPTYGNLRRFLRIRFEEGFMEPGDNFWFFFAGHGVRYHDRDYLMPLDGDPGDISATAIPISYVSERLQRSGADNVILLLDACRSEDRRAGVGVGSELQRGVVSFYACSPSEASYEIDQLGHGSFTHALLEGLRLRGQGNCATVERLDQHLRYQVPALNTQYQKPTQTPYAKIEPLSKSHLILLPEAASLQDVGALKNDALEAEAEEDLALAEQLWIRVLAASPADRQAIRAIQRLARKEVQRGVTIPNFATSDASARTVNDSNRAIVAPPPPPPKPTFLIEVVKVNAQETITDRQSKEMEYRTEDLGKGVELQLVVIPGGTFRMGSPANEEGYWDREEPQHDVTIQPFLMGRYAVTQAQWKQISALPKVNIDLEADPANFKGANRPVEQVSWYEAIEFCARLSKATGKEYRLPSEAEWEYACRAGTTTPFYFGETITTDLANYRGTDNKTLNWSGSYGQGPKGEYREQTTEVGQFPPNAYGLYDMHGNVYEWCADHWHGNYSGAPTDETPWLSSDEGSSRLLRGGSWGTHPRSCRSANRFRRHPDLRLNFIGFRVVCAS